MAPNSLAEHHAPSSQGFSLQAVILLILVAVAAATGWNGYAEYRHSIEKDYRLLEISAYQREARIAGMLRGINLTLTNLMEDLADRPEMSVSGQNALLRKYMRDLPEVRNMLIVDASGHIRAEAREISIGADVSQREYFKTHRAAPDNESFLVSRPFKASSGVIATPVTRAIRAADGRFAGVAIASIDASFFADAIKLDVQDSDVQVLLIHRQGDIVSAAPKPDWVGKNIQGGIAYTEHISSDQRTTRHLNVTKLDQVKRMSVFHDLANAPLTVIVSRNHATVINEWLQDLYSHLAGFILLTAATVVLLLLAAKRQRSIVDARMIIAEREAELRTIIDIEPDCVKQMASDGSLLSMNRAGLAMIEADSLEQVRGQKVEQLVLPEHRDSFNALSQRVFSGEPGSLVFEIQGLKGGRRWLETTAVPLRDARQRIVTLLAVTRDISERKQHEAEKDAAQRALEIQLAEVKLLQAELREQSIRDPLTGLYNRRYLMEIMPREWARAKREEYSLAVVMLDLDHFKKVNDTCGHAAGDAVLKALSVILSDGARTSDVVCRYGGEEFLLLMPKISISQALQRADSLRIALQETVVNYEGKTITVTLSAGIAALPDHGDGMESVLACADRALYRAKDEGRNRVLACGETDKLPAPAWNRN